MAFKNHGPGGCCCFSCWFWSDDLLDNDLTSHPGPTINGVTWEFNGSFSNPTAGKPRLVSLPPAAPANAVWCGAQPTLTQTESTDLINRGYPYNSQDGEHYDLVGKVEFDLAVPSGGVCAIGLSNELSGTRLLYRSCLVFSRADGGIFFGALQGTSPAFRTTDSRACAPAGNVVSADLTTERRVTLEFTKELFSQPGGGDGICAVVLSLDGAEVLRGRWRYIRYGGTTLPGVPNWRFTAVERQEIILPALLTGGSSVAVDNRWTPAGHNLAGFEIRNPVYTSQTTDECGSGPSDYFTEFDDFAEVHCEITGAADSEVNRTFTFTTNQNRVFAGSHSAWPATATFSTGGNDYSCRLHELVVDFNNAEELNPEQNFLGLFIIQFEFSFRQTDILPLPSWTTVYGIARFDLANNYQWPLELQDADCFYCKENTGSPSGGKLDDIWNALMGSSWTIQLYQSTTNPFTDGRGGSYDVGAPSPG